MSEFNLVSQPLRYYTKYLIEMQHFYSDCYITDCCIAHAAAAPPSVALCQNRQASANSYVSCTSRCPGDAGPFVRTDKQAPTDQGLQAHCCITNSCVAVCCCGLDPWEDALLSEQTSKRPVNKGFQSLPHAALDALGNFCQNRQASSYPQVIHSLWQSYPQLCPMNFQAWPKNLGPRSIWVLFLALGRPTTRPGTHDRGAS